MSSDKIWNFNIFSNFQTSEFSQTTLPPGTSEISKPPHPHLPDVLCRRPLIYIDINQLNFYSVLSVNHIIVLFLMNYYIPYVRCTRRGLTKKIYGTYIFAEKGPFSNMACTRRCLARTHVRACHV